MRGNNEEQDRMFSYRSAADRVPMDHPLRSVKEMANRALKELSAHFERMYAPGGRPSIPPEKLIRALLFQVLYSIRSERLLGAEIVGKFFVKIREQARERGLLSDEHFTVDGTLIEAWGSQKSFKAKDSDRQDPEGQGRNHVVDFRDTSRSNQIHRSTTDGYARLMKKTPGAEAKLGYIGNVLMGNRNGLVVEHILTKGSGTAERQAVLQMLEALGGSKRITVGAERAYDVAVFVEGLRQMRVTPQVAQKRKGSAIDKRTVRHEGYVVSQRIRKRVEEIFGRMKTVGCYRKTRFRGALRVSMTFTLALSAYNLVRIRNLAAQPAS